MTNANHLKALDQLGFVHRRLPTGDERNGLHHVPRQEFDKDRPSFLAVVEEHETRFSVTMPDGTFALVTFSANTPPGAVNQAAASLMWGLGL